MYTLRSEMLGVPTDIAQVVRAAHLFQRVHFVMSKFARGSGFRVRARCQPPLESTRRLGAITRNEHVVDPIRIHHNRDHNCAGTCIRRRLFVRAFDFPGI